MQNTNYEMFTQEGNELVHRIVLAGQALLKFDSQESVWEWAQHELRKLSRGSFMQEGAENTFGEATDTAVREAVYDRLGIDL